jgi:phosphoribosylglycinamide formyltransferase-1
VLAVEHRIYPLALALVAAGRVRIVGERCVIDGRRPAAAMLVVPQD